MKWLSSLIALGAFAAGRSVSFAAETDLVDGQALAPAGLVKYWQCPVPVLADESMTHLFLEDAMLYALTDTGAVYAIDADVGLVLWSSSVAEPPHRAFRPCHSLTQTPTGNPLTYVASSTNVSAFHRRTGRLEARMHLNFTAAGPPLVDSKGIYIGSVNNRYLALRPVHQGLMVLEPKKKGLKWYAVIVMNDGNRLYHEAKTLNEARAWQKDWVDRLGGPQLERKAAIMQWQIDTGGNVKARPAVVEGIAYIPSDDGQLIACDLSKKTKVWGVKVPGEILVDPLIGKGMVYFATTARCIYGVDRANGSTQWQCYVPVPLKRSGYLTKTLIYQPGEPTGIFAVDPVSGKLRWTVGQASDFLAEQGDTTYLFESGQAILQVETKTGELIRAIPCPDAALSVGNTRDTTIYLAGYDGRLMCIRPKDVPYLRRAQFEAAMRGLPEPKKKDEVAKVDKAPKEVQDTDVPGRRVADDPLRSRSALTPAVNPNPPGSRR